MKLRYIIITIIIILSIITTTFIITNPGLTGRTVDEELNIYSYTKALCNKNNFCEDYEIKCNGNEVTSVNLITGAFVKHPDNWEDPRDNPNDLCDQEPISP